MDFIAWPKVQQFHNVRKGLKERRDFHKEEGLEPYVAPTMPYRGKIKLDGTNAAISVDYENYVVQSRSRLITPEDDNMGFATWARDSGFGKALINHTCFQVTVFGEWCGKGIQKRCSISKLDRKVFAVFAVLSRHEGMEHSLIIEPEAIKDFIPAHPDVFVLPWCHEITVNWQDTEAVDIAVNRLNDIVAEVEKCDPWVKETFGIEGLGEGVVFYPRDTERSTTMSHLGNWGFKAKGEEHQVVRQKRAVIANPEATANVAEFVSKFVTVQRLEQGVREACGGQLDANKTGDFLKWFGQDVKSESGDELEASGLEWKDVSKAVMTEAKKWWTNAVVNS